MKRLRMAGALCALLFAVLGMTSAHGRPRPGSPYSSLPLGISSYSQREPSYHRKTRNDLSSPVPGASPIPAKARVDRQTQAVYSTLPDSATAGGHYSPIVGPSAGGSYGPPPPIHHEYPEPIIEIIIKESNESLPAPPPPLPPPPRKKPREPVHVFYVKYKQNPGEYGKDGSGGVVFDEPIPALTPAPPPEEEEEEEIPQEVVTAAPAPRPTTTLRAIIHPDSEIAHGSEGRLRVTFGGPHDGEHSEQPQSNVYGQGLKRADDKETQESVPSAPQPSIAFPGPAALTKRHQQQGPVHLQQTAEGRSHNPQPINQYQRQYTTIPQEAYRGPFAPLAPAATFRPTPQLQPLENPRYPNLPSFPSGGDRPVISEKPPPHQRQAPFPGSFPQNNYFSNRPPFAQPQHFPAPIPQQQQQQQRIPQHQLLRERHHQQVIQQQLLRQQQEQQQKLQQQQQVQQQQILEQQKQHQHVVEQQKQQQFALEQQKRQQLIDQQRQQQFIQQQHQIQSAQTPQQNPFVNIPSSSRFQPRPPISPISIPASAEIVKSIPQAELHKVEQVPSFQIQQNTAPFQPSQQISVDSLPIKPETPEQQQQFLKQRQYQQHQEALLRQQQILQQQQYQREQEQRIIQQQQEQQAYLRQRQEQEQLEHKQRQQFLQQHNSRTPDEDVSPYLVRFSPTPLPQPSVSVAPSTAAPSTTTTIQSTTETPATEAPKSDEPKIDLSKKLAELPDEVPDDVRQHLLSSGILKDAQIQILDYDKIGDVPIEDLPPHALENFYGAGGASATSASEPSPAISKPGSSKAASRSDDQDADNESEGSEIHERYAAPDDSKASASQVEMKVVRYDPTTAEGQSVADKYLQKDASQVDPVVLNDNRYNRYLPLKVSGTQFPLPEGPLLRGRQVTSVVVLAPVDYDYLKPLPSEAEEKSQAPDRTGRAVEAHGVRFLAGEALRNLVREPSTDNFRAWLQRERATPLEHQSVILLVTNSESGPTGQKPDRQIFMYDAISEQVSRLTGELSSSFVEVAESNAKSDDLDTLAEQGGAQDAGDALNTAASEPIEVRLKPERRPDVDVAESQWTPIVGYRRRSY